ncbi:Cysteine-rich receptor-like protein kinase [Gossypium australe]|uniref:Cysteine-rich receptor-like protein kinase n=1 Tax=Gossypium australe TaxID=47621 RepID=A0A5B6UTJ4_9ROSI|nr:Cysteine-rich receptor-like protein kinase [Gossypium australe]
MMVFVIVANLNSWAFCVDKWRKDANKNGSSDILQSAIIDKENKSSTLWFNSVIVDKATKLTLIDESIVGEDDNTFFYDSVALRDPVHVVTKGRPPSLI